MLQAELRGLGSVVVAYSGGLDSTFLAAVAHDVLGTRALAVTACSETYPEWEREQAVEVAQARGWRHELMATSELGIPEFAANPPDRCYHCKGELFRRLWEIARREGIEHVADGTTADDLDDHRPGRRAAGELGVVSPLLSVGFTKAAIRKVSRDLGLPTWSKPAFACLSSRFPYGEAITAGKVAQVAEAEAFLRARGVHQYRVRHHGEVARIEVMPEDRKRLLEEPLCGELVATLKRLGFAYVTVDLEGYRTGSMNETLPG